MMIEIVLVFEIESFKTFCGVASDIYDIARKGANLAVVSVAEECDYTFAHEIGEKYLINYFGCEATLLIHQLCLFFVNSASKQPQP